MGPPDDATKAITLLYRREGARHSFFGFRSRRWTYVAAAVLVPVATIGIGAGLQFRGTPEGTVSSTPPR